jgi:plasmid maintenance system antidote protein VapI
VQKGKNLADLARAADVSRDTISKRIEKRRPVTAAVAHAVFNALNDWHGGTLDRSVEITEDRSG